MRYMVRCQLDDLTAVYAGVDLIVAHNQTLWTVDATLEQTFSAIEVKVWLQCAFQFFGRGYTAN